MTARTKPREWPKPPAGGIWSFNDVFAAEYKDIQERCPKVGGGKPTVGTPTVANDLVGVALSGGGNRSSTFCLGVLQALNAAGVLKNVNYLSTVSGGGYIGTAMTIGMSKNAGKFPFGQSGTDVGETLETQHLRDTSRYLVQNGATSVISAAVVYLRGIVTNAIIVFPFLMFAAAFLVLLKPDTSRLATSWSWMSGMPSFFRETSMPLSVTGAAIVVGLLVVYAFGVSVVPIISLERRRLIAKIASLVMALFGLVVLVELHFMMLRMVFAAHGALPGSVTTIPVAAQVAETFVERAGRLVAWATPLVLAMLPFLKSISEKAVSGRSGSFSDGLKKWISRLILLLAAAIVPFLLWLTVLQLAYWGIGMSNCDGGSTAGLCDAGRDVWTHAPQFIRSAFPYADGTAVTDVGHLVGFYYLLVALALLVPWPILNVNANSLHQLYRDRLGSAFLVRRKPGKTDFVPADNFALSAIATKFAPYHLINAALNVPGSTYANRRGRNAEFFTFGKNFVGSEATGYVPTDMAEHVNDGLNIGTAMAISGAAAAPNMGMASMRPLSPTIALLNVRLGRWLRHPIDTVRDANRSAFARWWNGKPGPRYLLREAFSKSGADIVNTATEAPIASGFVFLTDGGHIENLGIYELLRRRCALIVAVDGEADPEMTSSSLVQLERFARIDLGTRIVMDWKPIGERTRELSAEVLNRKTNDRHGPHVALGLIDYPGVGGGAREQGLLVYVKSSMSGDENDYVMSYKAAHPAFPHETTMDQLFTEEQFEAYRALGEHIGGRFLAGTDDIDLVSGLSRALAVSRIDLLFR